MERETSDFEISFFEGLVKQKPNYIDALIPLAEAYTKAGLHEKGLEIDRRLARLRKGDPIIHYNLACSLALVGAKDEAFEVLQRTMELGYKDLDHMKRDPDLKSLRDDPRFGMLVSKTSN
ncbi:MAG: hypothetical protein HY584_06145 [Candidatus Omnitrophica bacterium]|nr:hypothetical protein [Candidatus Omnitrophota bacterium]